MTEASDPANAERAPAAPELPATDDLLAQLARDANDARGSTGGERAAPPASRVLDAHEWGSEALAQTPPLDVASALLGTPAAQAANEPAARPAGAARERGARQESPAVFTRVEAVAVFVLAAVLGVVALLRVTDDAPAPVRVLPDDGRTAPVAAYRLRIDVNTCGWERLTLVPGIGEITARRIVAERSARGPFRSLEDLTRVPGVGPKSLARWRPYFEPLGADADAGGAGAGAPPADSRSAP